MKLLRVEEAVGRRLAMDYTFVTPDRMGVLKRRGEVLREEDVEAMKSNGHYYVYVLEEVEERGEEVFETEAALELAKNIVSGPLVVEAGDEGKALVKSSSNGLLIVNSKGIEAVNIGGVIAVITRRNGSFIRAGELAAVVDVIPLKVSRRVLDDVISVAREHSPILALKPVAKTVVGVLVVGTEIVEGLKKDVASEVVRKKVAEYGGVVGRVLYARDDEGEIAGKILELLRESDAVIAVGGMSVDPTDRTHLAIRQVADEVVAYGIPMKPTTMSMIAYKDGKPLIGVSSGIVYFPDYNFLDVILPWVLSGVKVTREFIARLGEGGLSDHFLKKVSQKR
ncbi:MAG: molybdopterin-binding protein [Thermogladius sp.]|nr:molybdopterin-binding protein [Thermogladius sp.]